MPGNAFAAATDRLARTYPELTRALVARVLAEAVETVARKMGCADLAVAEDLARLRLDVRSAARLVS